jgi:hypothetical protein
MRTMLTHWIAVMMQPFPPYHRVHVVSRYERSITPFAAFLPDRRVRHRTGSVHPTQHRCDLNR